MKRQLIALFAMAILMSGCTTSQWNVGKGTGKQPHQPPMETPQKQAPKPKPEETSFHIDTVINTWGQPKEVRVNSAGNKVYVWENCKPTGLMIDKCDENGCSTVPETTCCERALVTDERGYVQNLKEAVNSCI
ncbi:MAG: hypothetical protein GX282_04540 [Campylobacteraceae bacterium]|nr:hypothetical protein [Campylobacteraceae bacterium]